MGWFTEHTRDFHMWSGQCKRPLLFCCSQNTLFTLLTPNNYKEQNTCSVLHWLLQLILTTLITMIVLTLLTTSTAMHSLHQLPVNKTTWTKQLPYTDQKTCSDYAHTEETSMLFSITNSWGVGTCNSYMFALPDAHNFKGLFIHVVVESAPSVSSLFTGIPLEYLETSNLNTI